MHITAFTLGSKLIPISLRVQIEQVHLRIKIWCQVISLMSLLLFSAKCFNINVADGAESNISWLQM